MRGAENGKLAGGLLAIVLLGSGVGIWPNMRASKSLDAEILDLSSRVERSDDGEAALQRLAVKLIDREQTAKDTLKHIPRDGNVGGIIRAMSHELGRLGLGRPEIRTGRPVVHPQAKALPMTVELHGDFLQLMSAVRWMESIDRLVRVRKVRFETPTGPGQTPLFGEPLKTELVLDVFYEPLIESPFSAEPVADAAEGTQ